MLKFEYYVLAWDGVKNCVERYNIFNNSHVQEHTEKEVKKYLRNRKKYSSKKYNSTSDAVLYGFDAFCEELRSIIMWQEWSRVEYEISVSEPFPDENSKHTKLDCFYQVELNVPMIAREVIYQYKESLKNK